MDPAPVEGEPLPAIELPKIPAPSLRVVRCRKGELFEQGVEKHDFDAIAVAITNPARTVADCFKFRSQIGIDVCVEALKESLRSRLTTHAEIDAFAALLRVRSTVKPYLEALS